jgi:hypothetical protein
LLALQRGRPDEALDLLRELDRATGERSSVGYPGAVKALALAAAGRADDALAAALMVVGDDRSTYLDRSWAGLAAGAAAARDSRRADVDARFTELCAQVDATDDRVAQAVVRLGRAMALEVVGDPGASALLDEASDRFETLGIDPGGWASVIRQAVGMTPAEPAPA